MNAAVLNVLGLATGLALYTMLLVMVVRDRARPGRFDLVPLATAVLGVLWNLCTLSAEALLQTGSIQSARMLSAVAFIALGFLPAVVVHSVIRGPRNERFGVYRMAVLTLAYAASIGAAVIQLVQLAAAGPVPSVMAMQLLTWTFLILAMPLVAMTRRQPGGRRALWVAALAAFAVSALHLSQLHEVRAVWPIELIGHQASIPLAVAILYQDYPFALADLFLKRAVLLIGFVVAAFAGLTVAGVAGELSPSQLTLLTTGWVLTALLYPLARRGVGWFVDSIVLDRPNYRSLEASVHQRLHTHDSTELLLKELCADLAKALCASVSDWQPVANASSSTLPIVTVSDGPTIHVSIPTSELPRYTMRLLKLTGGRQVLSGDVSFLTTVALHAARRIDAIRLTHERYERAVREQEIAKLASEAELQTLRAQINPHFLFNALNTIGYLIQTTPQRAVDTLMRLTSLLRAVLRSEGAFTTLGRELDMVEAYLDIERARFEQRLRVRIEVPESLRDWSIPPLILQPLVENAVKHGIAPQRSGGELLITAERTSGDGDAALHLSVIDSGAGMSTPEAEQRRKRGVGLSNVERRLACYYGVNASLRVTSSRGGGTTAELRIPIGRSMLTAVEQVS